MQQLTDGEKKGSREPEMRRTAGRKADPAARTLIDGKVGCRLCCVRASQIREIRRGVEFLVHCDVMGTIAVLLSGDFRKD